MMQRVFCLAPVLALLAASALAQSPTIVSKCPADAPIKLTPGSVSTDTHRVSVIIQNTSQKPVSAVILSWSLFDANGDFSSTTSSVDYAPSGSLLLPGQSLDTADADVSTAAGLPAKVEINCSTVLFEGKDAWGSGSSVEANKLKAVRQGIAAERIRLLAIYKQQGEARLVEELNRQVVK